ncbi:inner centromere protein [Elysia marginata]|uniref:Inner centromere protein n=1 Tax=Elysia marginata TaxID=1093978 RepID=A0AAV4GXS3_9GAST|nr:inner centromere protein [Elysia marginata]
MKGLADSGHKFGFCRKKELTQTLQATMAEEDLLKITIFTEPFHECQDLQQKLLDNFQEELQWVDEIFHTLCSAFTVKSEKLTQMPKTPSAKNKMQKRKRKKEEMIKIEEESSSPKTSRMKVTRLKFEEPEEDQVEETDSLNTGRPMRKCRASKNVSTAKAASSTRQTRGKKQVEESAGTSSVVTSPVKSDENEISKRISDAAVTSAKGNTLKTEDRAADESSPSVRTRIKEYESRILTPVNNSGTKAPTPKTGSHSKSGQRVNTAASKTGGFIGEKGISQDSTTPPKPTRTRLRLKKQPNEPAEDRTKLKKHFESTSDSEIASSTSTEPCSSEESEKEETEMDVIDSSLDNGKSPKAVSTAEPLSETQVVISEVYELSANGSQGKLQKFEVVKTKTTPAAKTGGRPQEQSSPDLTGSDTDMDTDSNSAVKCESPQKEETSRGPSTRTRTRAKPNDESDKKAEKKNKDSGVVVSDKVNSTSTTESESDGDQIVRSTRTRARVQKEKEAAHVAPVVADPEVEEPVRSTRTRQRAQDKEVATKTAVTESSKQGSQNTTPNLTKAKFMIDGRDEKITGSPAAETRRSSYRCAKRILEHGRGLSPAPKRARSIVGEELDKVQPLSTSSPIRNLDESEMRDKVPSASRAPRPFKFTNAQRNVSSFLNRTPGFWGTPNSSQLNSTRCTFLSKATPSPQRGPQSIFNMEQRKKQLVEKENKEKERLRRFEEKRKQDLEKRKRDREERFQRIAAFRNEQEEKKKQQEEQYMKKYGATAANKAKLQEEKEREEAEKRKQRQKKQIEADLRRKLEEEERQRRRLEQEEEARQQEALFLKKRKQEELSRKQKLAEEKLRNEERLAEKEQRLLEEKAKMLQLQREKELLAEKARIEKENQLLQERLERERIEKEKKAEKEKKIREEMERLKAMEQERLYLREQELQKQKELAQKERELKQMISNHNKSILTQKQPSFVGGAPQPSVLNTTQTLNTSKTNLNTTHTLNTSKTVPTAPVNSSSYEMTPAKIYVNKSSSNYGLDDKESDDSTDDEDAPKKKIPEWAEGINLKAALIKQFNSPPDLDMLFRFSAIAPPDLEKIFKGNCKKRYKQRTSSAIWNTPPIKYC